MSLIYRYVFQVIWIIWAGYWWSASRKVKPFIFKEPAVSRLLHLIPLGIAFVLLALPNNTFPEIDFQILSPRYWELWFWLGLLMTLAGLIFTVWARRCLGKNWSGTVTIKKGHELIVEGPYSIVRNPMYSGLLSGFIGTAVSRGNMLGFLAVVLAFATLLRKIKIEEKVLLGQFEKEFSEYTKKTKALIPFLL